MRRRTRPPSQVDKWNPRTSSTVNQLLDCHLATLDVGRTTHRMYRPSWPVLYDRRDAVVTSARYREIRSSPEDDTGSR
jgi:hypothetical protein